MNPLLRPAGSTGDDLLYRRRFPTERFADDNPPLRDYLPAAVAIPRRAVAGHELDRRHVEHLIASTAVLAMPETYRKANLPRIERVPATGPRDGLADR